MDYDKAIELLNAEWPEGDWIESEEKNTIFRDDYIIAGKVGRLTVELYDDAEGWVAAACGEGVRLEDRPRRADNPVDAVKKALNSAPTSYSTKPLHRRGWAF